MSGGEGSAEPDLTPMLDMVFQLITFFMLVVNFQNKEVDKTISLPVIGSARPVDTKGLEDLLLLNVDSQGNINVFGAKRDVETYIAAEAQAALKIYRKKKADAKLGDELPTIVVIRADKGTPFKLLNRVIKACQSNGFRNFAMKADSTPKK